MKRILVAVTCLFIILSAFGCKPTDISDEYYDYGCEALEVAQKYLDGDIDQSEAYSRLEIIDDGIDNIYKSDKSAKETGIDTYVTLLKVDLAPIAGLGKESAMEHHELLKETLGK